MNEAIIGNYLDALQEGEPEYMTEGIREFVAKFDKQMLKRTIDKLHRAFSNGDGQTFDEVAKKTAKIGKLPKYKEVMNFMGGFTKEHPEMEKSVELARKVAKNTFKIRDKAKLEIVANAVGMTSYVKSKGGRYDTFKITKTTLQDINTQVSNIYDTGFENMETSTPEEEKMKERMESQSKKQEKVEMIVVGVVISVLVAAIIWAGIAIWGFFTSPAVIGTITIIALLIMVFKTMLWLLGISAVMIIPVLTYMKATA
jgi:hypothetical protein